MSILSGYGKFKRYLLTNEGYKLCSQWTSSNTVHFDDNKTAQTKLGAIDGITDSLTATSSNVALSAKAGKSLQDQVTELNTGLGNGVFKVQFLSVANNAGLQYFLSHYVEGGYKITLTMLNVNYGNNPIYTAAGNPTSGGVGVALGYKTGDSLHGSVIYFAYEIQKIVKCDLKNGVWGNWVALS